MNTIGPWPSINRLLGQLSHDRDAKDAPTGTGDAQREYATPLHGVAQPDRPAPDGVPNTGSTDADSHQSAGCWATTIGNIAHSKADTMRAALLIVLIVVGAVVLEKVSGSGTSAISWPLLAITGAGHLRRPPKK